MEKSKRNTPTAVNDAFKIHMMSEIGIRIQYPLTIEEAFEEHKWTKLKKLLAKL